MKTGPSPARAARAARAAAAGAWGRVVPGRDRRHAAGLAVAPVARAAGARGIAAGGARPVPVDFALLCATHRPLAHEGADAPVRPDLYFRIAEYTVTLGRCASGRTCASCCARSGTRRARRRRCRPWSSGRWPATPGRAITGSWSRCCARCACWPARRAWRACRCCRRRSSAGALMRRGMRRASPRRRRRPACRPWQTRPSARRWPRMAAMSAVRRVCWACTAARCTGAWRRWKRPGRTAVGCRDQARWRSGAGDQRISRASSAPGSGARMKASPTRKASTLCWRIS